MSQPPPVLKAVPGGGPRRKKRFNPAAALLPWVIRFLSLVLGTLPRRIALAFGRLLGSVWWTVSRRDRRRALEHLAFALPELSESERRRIARAVFLHQGMNGTELLHLFRRDPFAVVPHIEVHGWEVLETARATGRPILILTGHCGSWELLAPLLKQRDIPIAAMARPANDPRIDALIVALRAHLGTTTIARGTTGAARQLLATLRKGGLLAMLIDQDTKVDGVWVPFFGRPAFTPVGAAELALRQKAIVLPFFIERKADGDHLLRFLPPLDLPNHPREATALMTRTIEEQVRRRPEQWVWMHRRWRRQPDASVP